MVNDVFRLLKTVEKIKEVLPWSFSWRPHSPTLIEMSILRQWLLITLVFSYVHLTLLYILSPDQVCVPESSVHHYRDVILWTKIPHPLSDWVTWFKPVAPFVSPHSHGPSPPSDLCIWIQWFAWNVYLNEEKNWAIIPWTDH